jgi:hypothetical protein
MPIQIASTIFYSGEQEREGAYSYPYETRILCQVSNISVGLYRRRSIYVYIYVYVLLVITLCLPSSYFVGKPNQ